VSTGASTGASGSSYSLDGGQSWTDIDPGTQHTAVAFLNPQTGWSGSFNTNFLGGIFRGSIPTGGGSYCVTNIGGSSCDITQVAILGTSLNVAPSGCAFVNGSQYSSYPASGNTTATLQTGQVYSLAINTNSSRIISAWVDWNQNGVFGTSEWFQVTTVSTPGTTDVVTFTVPTTALPGTTRLRIRTRLDGNPNGPGDACTNFGSGETQDYTITVQTGTANTSNPAPYCTAPQNFGCVGPNISAVQLLGTPLLNNSGCSTNSAGDAYTRYPASGSTTATVQRGASYNLSVTTDVDAIVSVWVDWDQNLAFDATEWRQVYLTGTSNTISLPVPNTAVLGQTRMRIRSRVSTSANGPLDACTAFGSGEAEDYTLTVTSNPNSSNPAPYCAASHPSTCGTADIVLVNLAGTPLNNASGCSDNGSSDSYFNYPATGSTTGTVQRGQSYALSVNTSAQAIVSAWVDWNRDLQLSASEWTQVYTNGTSGTVTLTVPANASLGTTRLRIRSRLSGNPNGAGDACSQFLSGEAEDYTLTITGCTLAAPTVTAPGSVCAGTTLTFTAQGVPAGSTYLWTGPNSFTSTLPNPTIPNVTPAATGSYSLTITQGGCSASSQPFTVTVNALPAAPATIGASRCGTGSVTLTAAGPAGSTYRWYTTATGGTPISGQSAATFNT
ncbi:MAG TPA: GEVED domain-containing protein, partial [bacterium]|nr:GEVED domain-containing protein [bacterium]